MDENLKENLKNLSSLLKKYHGQQLITNDEFQAGISDIVNAFAQYRSASQKINKDHEEVLNSVLKQINEEYDRILNELENTKRGANSATTEAISIAEETKKLLSDVYKIKEEILLMKPEDGEDGEDADEEKIIEEVLKRIPPQEPQELPDMEEFENKIEEKFKDIYEQIKRSVKGFPGVRLLASLMDVSITNPTNGQTLVYNSTTSKFENGTIGGGGSGSGDVVGPGSSTNDNIAVFNGTTGKIIKDGGATISAINSAISAKQDSDADLTAVAGLSTTGIAVRTGAGAWAVRDLSYPAEGLTITNNAGIAGNPTFALANDLAALEGLSSTGIPIRTGTDTWSQRTLDTDGTLAANSDSNIATQKATKTYVDTMVAGLLDYRGGYNASGNVFPSSGGSGTAGAVMKGDMWVISNAGTLGGTAVQVGDSLIANVDTPGQTAGNWNILNGNISYVPEDVANKSTTTSLGTSDTLYPTQNAVKTYADTKALLAGSTSQAFSVSQLEVGHASDTSITRVSAGIIAVEGVTILRTVDVDDTPVNGATTDPVSSNWAYDHAALASSDTVVGHVEIATSAETTTGTDATRAISPDGLAGSEFGKRTVSILVSDPNGDAITTGDGKAVFPIDTTLNGMNLVAVKGYLSTVSSSGAPNVQIRRSRRSSATARTTADMLSTALTIDASEFESADAATAAVINTSNDDVQTGDMIFIDIDGAGTGAKGLQVLLTFQLP